MIGRPGERKRLESIYEMEGNQMIVLYGRRGCQKEALIRDFVSDKKVFYYRGRNASPMEQLRQLQNEVKEQYQVSLVKDSYDECFNRIKSGDASKLVVVIDEFQDIVKKDSSMFASLVKLKGKRLYPGPVMIILMNSSVAWTDREMKDCLGEEYKRIDDLIKLEDVKFIDIVRAFPSYSVAECTQTYGILGGVPAYLNRWNGKKSIRENICNNILDPNGFLFEEAEGFIRSELRELSVYDTILASVAAGNEKLNDLYKDTGYSRAKISVYIKNLTAFDVMEKVVSFETGGWDNAKKGIYRIGNNYVNFWFKFVYPHLSDLYVLSPESFYDQYIARELDDYLNRYFVQVCTEYLQLLNLIGKVPIKMVKTGTWIGKSGTIDIIGQNEIRENVVGICNWREKELTFEAYEALLDNMKKAKITAKTCYLFSAKTFDEQLKALAKQNPEVILVDMNEL